MGSLPNLHELGKERLPSPAAHRVRPAAPAGRGPGPAGPPAAPPSSSDAAPHQPQQQQQQQQPPPPLARTHRRARSSSGHHHHHHAAHQQFWDNEAMLEHMSSYSPISCRSARASALSCRRRDSLSSSAGASSVRRLIAAVRAAPSGPRPPRRAVLRHCAAVLLGHASWSAATMPILPLQAGLGAFEPQLGPMPLALLYAAASLASCFAPLAAQRMGTNMVVCLGHLLTVVFVGVHLYPKWYLLLPSYALLGAWTSPSFLARVSHVNVSATSLALVCSDPEDPDETRRECILRRLNRGVKLAEDMGLAFGCLLASVLIKLTDTRPGPPASPSDLELEGSCGAEYCPEDAYLYNGTRAPMLPRTGGLEARAARTIVSVWLGLAVLALGISCAFLDGRMREPQAGQEERQGAEAVLGSVRAAFQDPRMQLAAPLTLFVGLEQGFIFADFTEAYVVCALGGAGNVTLSFLSLGLLQALAGATLSMLMRHIRRYFVIAVGFAFHACLLLVLVTWRPADDDPALFHVISAAWGVCNAIWETLIYTLLLGLHPGGWQGPLAASLFWRWLGSSLALGLHGIVCTRLRVLGLAAMLLLAVVPYTWLEVRLDGRGKSLPPL